MIKIEYYNIPNFYLSAFVNGDQSGLTTEDAMKMNQFINDELKTHKRFWCLSDVEDLGFMTYHDLQPYGVLACDCSKVAFDVGE